MAHRYLVFGNGFIATNLVLDLLQKKKEVYVVGYRKLNPNIPKSIQVKGQSQIREIERILKKRQPDYIFLTQGISFIPSTERDVGRSVQANLVAPLRVLEVIYKLTQSKKISVKKLITFGSAAEYGDIHSFSKNTDANPSSLYGLSKYWLFQASNYYASLGLPCIHLRQCNTIGIYQNPLFVLPSFCRQVALIEKDMQKPELQVGDLTQERDFIDIRDAINAYQLVLEKAKPGSAINICTGRSREVMDLVILLKNLSKVPFEISVKKELVAPKRIRSNLFAGKPTVLESWNWKQQYDLQQSIEWVLHHWRGKIGS